MINIIHAVRMLLAVSYHDMKRDIPFTRIFEKSFARWRKRGFERMFFKLADEYIETGAAPLPRKRKHTEQSKKVLFIDAVTPSSSSDAGGYAALEEIKLFQQLGFSVDFLPLQSSEDEEQRRSTLRSLNVDILEFDESPIDAIRRTPSIYRYFFITRFHVAEIVMKAIRWWSPHSHLILNLADLHYLREQRLAGEDQARLAEANATKLRELNVIANMDMTLSYSQVELETLVREGINTQKLGLCPWVIAPHTAATPAFDKRLGIAFLGGFKHQPNVEAVEWFTQQVLPLLRQRLPDCTLSVYGSHAESALTQLQKSPGLEIKGWVEQVDSAYNHCRVFVAPLQSGAGVKGKVIGALAYGVPCVLSPCAAEGIPVRDGIEALMADTPEQWVEQIAILYENEELWYSVSKKSQQLIVNHYSQTNALALMKNNLNQVII